jgi:hypothetical protein
LPCCFLRYSPNCGHVWLFAVSYRLVECNIRNCVHSSTSACEGSAFSVFRLLSALKQRTTKYAVRRDPRQQLYTKNNAANTSAACDCHHKHTTR